MNKNILILGAGQFGFVAKEIAESMDCFERIDFLDDCKDIAIGKLSDYERFVSGYHYAVVAMGNPAARLSWLYKLETAGYKIAVLVSPKASIAPSAQLAKGTIIEPMAVVQTHSVLETGCIISAGAVVRHDAFLGEGCHCDCHSLVYSGARVPAQTKIQPFQMYSAK